MSSHNELRIALDNAIKAAAGPELTSQRAMEIAKDVLKDHPEEFRQFDEWWKKHGELYLTNFV